MKDPVKAALVHSVCVTEINDPRKERNLTAHCKIMNYLLSAYATDDAMVQSEAKTTNFKQPKQMSAVGYLEVLWEKYLHFCYVYEGARLKEHF